MESTNTKKNWQQGDNHRVTKVGREERRETQLKVVAQGLEALERAITGRRIHERILK